MAEGPIHQHYEAFIDDASHVYDGDTVTHVYIQIGNAWEHALNGEIYPEIFVDNRVLWMHSSVRLAGIDCPEYHPRHRLPNGKMRDPKDVGWEHSQAVKAKQVLQDLIIQNNLKFEIANPQIGKYAGRIVAEVWVPDPYSKDKQFINASDRLLEKGLAYKYEGGTKQIWRCPDDSQVGT